MCASKSAVLLIMLFLSPHSVGMHLIHTFQITSANLAAREARKCNAFLSTLCAIKRHIRGKLGQKMSVLARDISAGKTLAWHVQGPRFNLSTASRMNQALEAFIFTYMREGEKREIELCVSE